MLAAQAGAIEPGAEAETVVLVRNTGEVADTFHVIVQGPASSWAIVDPPSVSLAPGAEAPVWVHFRPPRSPDTIPGRVVFDVVVAALGEPDFLAVQQGTIDVGTYSSIAATFVGEVVTRSKWAEVEVNVRNTGNRSVNVLVEAEADEPGVEFEISAGEFGLAAGETAEVVVRVRPPRRMLPRRAHRRMTVSVVSDGGALATLRTEYPADDTLTDELIRSARVLLILLVLLAVGGLALLRSQPEADDAAAPNDRVRLPVAPPITEAPPDPVVDDPVGDAPNAEPSVAVVDESVVEGVAVVPTPTPSPPPPLPRLVFVRTFDASVRDLVVREPGARGSELRLRTDGARESRPRLSPNDEFVAFIRERDAAWKVCVIAATGGEATCVADTTSDAAVAWSSDGSALYFSRSASLVSVPYDPITQVAGSETNLGVAVPGGQFALSPDGQKIVVAEGRRLVVRPLDGSAATSIDVPANADDPSFSPDGGRIVYTADFQIFSAPVGGGAVRQLTSPGTVNGEAAWTGEGDWVVFRSNRSGLGDLYCVKGGSGGGNEQGLAQITASPERETTASF